MKANVGTLDRAVRIVAGLVLIAFAVMSTGIAWAWIGWIGIIPLITGLAGRCPAYSVFGVSSCPMEENEVR